MKPALPVTSTFTRDYSESRGRAVLREQVLDVEDHAFGLAESPNCFDAHVPKLVVSDGDDDGVVVALWQSIDHTNSILIVCFRGVHPRIVHIDVRMVFLEFHH